MAQINCEINLILNWSKTCVLSSYIHTDQRTIFAVTAKKLCVPVVTLSTQDYRTLLEQSKSDFKRIINCNKNKSKLTSQKKLKPKDYLIDPSFQEVNRPFCFIVQYLYTPIITHKML